MRKFAPSQKYMLLGGLTGALLYHIPRIPYNIIFEQLGDMPEFERAHKTSAAFFPHFSKGYTENFTKDDILLSKSAKTYAQGGASPPPSFIHNFTLSEASRLQDSESSFQSWVFAVVDSRMGLFAAVVAGFKPIATATLEMQTLRPLSPNQNYTCIGRVANTTERRISLAATVLDEAGEEVARFSSQFARVNWYGLPKFLTNLFKP